MIRAVRANTFMAGDRWLLVGGIFARMKRAMTWPAVPTASFPWMDGSPKMTLSELPAFVLSLCAL